jgi:hypothetical protein
MSEISIKNPKFPKKVSRRNMLMTVGIALNAVAGILFAVPFGGLHSWPGQAEGNEKGIGVGNARPINAVSRRRNPAGHLPQSFCPPVGRRHGQHSLLGAADFRRHSCRSLQSTARTWVVPCGGFRNRDCSCVRVMAARIMPMAPAPPVRRRAAFSHTTSRLKRPALDQSRPGSDSGLAAEPGLCRSTQEVLMRLIKDLGGWFDQRLQLGKPIQETMAHPVPRSTASWAYVFGSGSLTVMMLQFVTGICLAFVYVPSADQAWTSLQVLNHQQSFGWFIRALHGWGSNFMVALVLMHMVQVFLFGAYKFPRELTWMVGVCLLLMTSRHGLHRPGAPLRPGCLLGAWHRRFSHGPNAFHRTTLVHSMLGGPIIAGRNLVALLCHPRVHRSWSVDRFCRRAFAHGAQAGRQRMADAGPHRQDARLTSRSITS